MAYVYVSVCSNILPTAQRGSCKLPLVAAKVKSEIKEGGNDGGPTVPMISLGSGKNDYFPLKKKKDLNMKNGIVYDLHRSGKQPLSALKSYQFGQTNCER